MTFAIWITGLPGSGKSTISKELSKLISEAVHLRLDEIRKKYVPKPVYSEEERELVYSKFINEGTELIKTGKSVIYDATAHKIKWRDAARSQISDFIEVYVKCPIEECIKRETQRKDGLVQADLYKRALERILSGEVEPTLGNVVGVDVAYEENQKAEVIIDSIILVPKDAAKMVFESIKKRGWIK